MKRAHRLSRTGALIGSALLVGLLPGCAPKNHSVNQDLRARVKTVAIVSVYGPKEMHHGFFKSFRQDESLNYIEAQLISHLRQSGFSVIPLAQSKTVFESEIDQALVNTLKGRSAGGGDAAYVGKLRAALQNSLLASTGTCQCADPTAKDESRRIVHSERYLKAVAGLAQKLNADAFVVIRAEPVIDKPEPSGLAKINPLTPLLQLFFGQERAMEQVDITMYDSRGELVFRDRVLGVSKEGFGVVSMRPDAEKVTAGMRQAADDALRVAFSHLNGQWKSIVKRQPPGCRFAFPAGSSETDPALHS